MANLLAMAPRKRMERAVLVHGRMSASMSVTLEQAQTRRRNLMKAAAFIEEVLQEQDGFLAELVPVLRKMADEGPWPTDSLEQ